MWLRWLPWRMAIRQMARRSGFLDPFTMIAQLQRFAQPSEVAMPVELVRLASVLHARGLVNSQAIQHNLDWVWPYWVERQFNPEDPSFVPRAFSISHINLTHRNWTAVGVPGSDLYPLVDPAGLVTPFFNSWSIDAWIVVEKGDDLIPSRLPALAQKIIFNPNLAVITQAEPGPLALSSRVEVKGEAAFPFCQIQINAFSQSKAWCVISLRPYNPEGISFIHRIQLLEKHWGWKVNRNRFVYFDTLPDSHVLSDYRHGDAYHFLPHSRVLQEVICDAGMATAAALFELTPGESRAITVTIPLKEFSEEEGYLTGVQSKKMLSPWPDYLKESCKLQVPDEEFQYLFDAAIRTLILHAPGEVYPGPYTYKHFWFRDAAFILHAMLCAGFPERVKEIIQRSFFCRQKKSGYFYSQDGEWDSNGQALWLLKRYCELTGESLPSEWRYAVAKAAEWIEKKRLCSHSQTPHAGLFPPGFSAEHLGPNDYYYWDDFWGVAGLEAAAYFSAQRGNRKNAAIYQSQRQNFMESIESSLKKSTERLKTEAMPASPYRRLDSGCIGSLVAGYPLQLWQEKDARLLKTAAYLMHENLVHGGFFHDMSHSGINPYLTLHIAQTLLRAGNSQFFELVKAVAELASPTGQWPEAIHPQTGGGCMGDGQHVWAAAEWVLMLRNCFVREEQDALILCSGIPAAWLESKEKISFGPTLTKFGKISVTIMPEENKTKITWRAGWFAAPPKIEIRLPDHESITAAAGQNEIEFIRMAAS